jgi:glycosyltransferase involved in cell wall biosynthesis
VKIIYLTPPAKTSNERDIYRKIPGAFLHTIDAEPLRRPADTVLPIRAIPGLGSPDRWTGALAWYRHLDQIALTDFDIVLSSELYGLASVQAGRLARRIGAAHVVVVAEILDRSPLNWLPPWRTFRRANARNADFVIGITEHATRHAHHMGVPEHKTAICHPGIDLQDFSPAAELSEGPRAVFLGELRPDKGILDVIAAGDAVSRSFDGGFQILVAGDGPLRSEVETAAMSRPWLKILGKVPRAEVPDLLRSARVLVAAPWQRKLWAEQFGYGLVEAMATGLPVVTTDCGAISEIVPSSNPIVAEHDVEGIANGIMRCFGPEGIALGALNREAASRLYSIETQASRLGEILGSVASRKGDR